MHRLGALSAVSAAALLLSACETTSGVRGTMSSAGSAVGSRVAAIPGAVRSVPGRVGIGGEPRMSRRELEERLADAELRVADLERQMTDRNGALVEPALLGGVESFDSSLGGGVAGFDGDAYPADARPGQCFARVLTPPATTVVTQTVESAPETTEYAVVPAQFEEFDETVLTAPERTVTEVVPATYRNVAERVMVEPERTELVVVPAEYETYEERVLVRPEYTTWRRGEGLFGSASASPDDFRTLPTGELMCRVTIPAEYETVTRRRLVRDARTVERVVPARFETVTKRVLDQPSRVIERVMPATYATVTRRREVAPARAEAMVRPASVATVEQVEIVGEPRLEWREVLCRTNATRDKVREVQVALGSLGYAPGGADGVFGPRTLAAMEAFQRDRDLSIGQLTRETVEALGVPFTTRDDI
ncbi:MAG: peptidoglycan-binding protein [Caulobacterales bacterium]|nr:peptidoglycan-binding protein [Caulobacterales bacterium]